MEHHVLLSRRIINYSHCYKCCENVCLFSALGINSTHRHFFVFIYYDCKSVVIQLVYFCCGRPIYCTSMDYSVRSWSWHSARWCDGGQRWWRCSINDWPSIKTSIHCSTHLVDRGVHFISLLCVVWLRSAQHWTQTVTLNLYSILRVTRQRNVISYYNSLIYGFGLIIMKMFRCKII